MKEDTKKIIEELRKDKKSPRNNGTNNSLNEKFDLDEKIKHFNAKALLDEERQKKN